MIWDKVTIGIIVAFIVIGMPLSWVIAREYGKFNEYFIRRK